MATKDFKGYVSTYDNDLEDQLTVEEIKKLDMYLEKEVSRKECLDKNINISLIALSELKSIGFKEDIPSLILSKLVEDVYHERNYFDASDYFDLSNPDNEHYSKLVDDFVVDEQQCRAMIAISIGKSDCENKNINEIVYGVVTKISNKMKNDNTYRLEA